MLDIMNFTIKWMTNKTDSNDIQIPCSDCSCICGQKKISHLLLEHRVVSTMKTEQLSL